MNKTTYLVLSLLLLQRKERDSLAGNGGQESNQNEKADPSAVSIDDVNIQ